MKYMSLFLFSHLNVRWIFWKKEIFSVWIPKCPFDEARERREKLYLALFTIFKTISPLKEFKINRRSFPPTDTESQIENQIFVQTLTPHLFPNSTTTFCYFQTRHFRPWWLMFEGLYLQIFPLTICGTCLVIGGDNRHSAHVFQRNDNFILVTGINRRLRSYRQQSYEMMDGKTSRRKTGRA